MHYIYYLYGIAFLFFYVEFIYLVLYKRIYKHYELDKYEGNVFFKYIDVWILCFITTLIVIIYNTNSNWKVVTFFKNIMDVAIVPYRDGSGFGGSYFILIQAPWIYGFFIEDKDRKRRLIGILISITLFVLGVVLLVKNT